jgi:hypothetical protein
MYSAFSERSPSARWSVTAAFLDLREQLGLALVADDAEAQVTPPPRRQEWSV